MKKILMTISLLSLSAGVLATTARLDEKNLETMSKKAPAPEERTISHDVQEDPIVNTRPRLRPEQERQEEEVFEENGNGSTTNPRVEP